MLGRRFVRTRPRTDRFRPALCTQSQSAAALIRAAHWKPTTVPKTVLTKSAKSSASASLAFTTSRRLNWTGSQNCRGSTCRWSWGFSSAQESLGTGSSAPSAASFLTAKDTGTKRSSRTLQDKTSTRMTATSKN